jgi:hypothetical protein
LPPYIVGNNGKRGPAEVVADFEWQFLDCPDID